MLNIYVTGEDAYAQNRSYNSEALHFNFIIIKIIYLTSVVSLLKQHSIERKKEDDFRKNLEEFKYSTVRKLPLRCSTMQYSGRFERQTCQNRSELR